jgi:thymidylate synthase
MGEKQYLDLLQDILDHGVWKENKQRNSVRTKSVFGRQLRFDLAKGFPAMTTRRLWYRAVVEELLWFLRGDTSSVSLEEKGISIWKGNSSREYLDSRGLDYPEGELGRVYGAQWVGWDGINQVKKIIRTIRENPDSRKMLVSAWNVGELDQMALEPCHDSWQVHVANNRLSLLWRQRSVDAFHGITFNIASYATLAHLLALCTGCELGDLILHAGDVHVYEPHLPHVETLLSRQPYPFPQLEIKGSVDSYEDLIQLQWENFSLANYQYHPKIKASMVV